MDDDAWKCLSNKYISGFSVGNLTDKWIRAFTDLEHNKILFQSGYFLSLSKINKQRLILHEIAHVYTPDDTKHGKGWRFAYKLLLKRENLDHLFITRYAPLLFYQKSMILLSIILMVIVIMQLRW
jgi:hypothetical protein